MPNAFITHVPLLIIALIALFAFWSMGGKEIPDRAVGIGGFAWYQHLRGRAEEGKPDSTT